MSLLFETFNIGPMDNNLYMVIDDDAKEFVVIDPSLESTPAVKRAEGLVAAGYRFVAIWNTHGHFDHVYDNARWKAAFGVPLYAHPSDGFFLEHLREQAIWFGFPPPEVVQPDFPIEPGSQELHVGSHHPQVLSIPGHSPGSVGFYFPDAQVCISGDVLFAGSVGRADLPGASEATLASSVRRLIHLPAGTRILPGHGPATTVAMEIASNQVAKDLLNRHPVSA
jgi:glyoxylase-like metal-dependent hydrolase (beta-lactamase superfamily II)